MPDFTIRFGKDPESQRRASELLSAMRMRPEVTALDIVHTIGVDDFDIAWDWILAYADGADDETHEACERLLSVIDGTGEAKAEDLVSLRMWTEIRRAKERDE